MSGRYPFQFPESCPSQGGDGHGAHGAQGPDPPDGRGERSRSKVLFELAGRGKMFIWGWLFKRGCSQESKSVLYTLYNVKKCLIHSRERQKVSYTL